MFIKIIETDYWSGNRDLGGAFEVVDLEMVEKSLRELDGKVKTLVNLLRDENAHMSVGGGGDGIFISYITYDNETFFNLVDLSKSDKKVELCVGGQYGEYPEKMCVPLEKVLIAARCFATEGQLDDKLQWEKD
jgi:hypothetical protein